MADAPRLELRRACLVAGLPPGMADLLLVGVGAHADHVLLADQLDRGRLDEDSVYLLPDAAFRAVSRLCRDMGEPFPLRQDRLKRELARGRLSECDPRRHSVVARVGGQRRRVLRLRRRAVEALLEEELPAPSPPVTGVTGFSE
ncbi:MAG: hypothetical protein HY726_02785 [Candidatus Rokubacteria bacterium]|nr:hypothetical protein [Candidatus Rokubacteria bacterium]